jgi:hypothetical protein
MRSYTYVNGNPLNSSDPSGLCGLDVFQACDPRCPDSVQPLGPWQCAAGAGVAAIATNDGGQGAHGVCSDFSANKVGTNNALGVVGIQKCWVTSSQGSAILTTTYQGQGFSFVGTSTSFFQGNTCDLSAYGGPFNTVATSFDLPWGGIGASHSEGGGVIADTFGPAAGPPGVWAGTTNTTVQWTSHN